MNDNILDERLRLMLQPDIEPDEELNILILKKASEKGRRKRGARYFLPRVAAAVLIVAVVGTGGVYAANYILDKVKVIDGGMYVGNDDFMTEETFSDSTEEVKVEDVGEEKPGPNDKWISKKSNLVSGVYRNDYYTYSDYKTMIEDTDFDNIFTSEPLTLSSAIYTVTDMGADTKEYSIDVIFADDNEREVFLYLSYMIGNVADDAVFSVPLIDGENERVYTSESGLEFTLVDSKRSDDSDEKKTSVLISYDRYRGSIDFTNLSEDEIHDILDTITISK